ncbi:hypothetical protein [uncultured Microbulbifer sp.]|uniref:hypothetical protein n=1 Tax=uncultured Microbulbifer sp. TaxID=348147 RepID=UPI002630EBBB|nr:hypothetical protein [uncultured Microbulbifer sp.]
MFSNETFTRELRIAGSTAGKPVTITPQAEPIYHELVKKARKGNYWAQTTVNGLHQLASGRLHQNNIFIKPGAVHRGGTEEFYVILPGCKATVEKLESDTFRVLYLEADLDFFELQKQEIKPGLYSASHKDDEWKTKFKRNGSVDKIQERRVAIADSNYGRVDETADAIFENLSEAPFTTGNTLKRTGYDLHYTPQKENIGRLQSYRYAICPLDDERIHESAILLARTMYNARKIEGVGWIAEFGGSAVLTQAMKILAGQNVKLEDHTVYMHRPTTSPNEAIKQAHKLGLQIERNFSKSDMTDWVGNQSQLKVIVNRLKDARDNYKWSHAAIDAITYGKSAQGLAASGVAAVAYLSGLAGMAISAPAIPAVLTLVGAVAVSGAGALKTANNATKSIAPKFHNKHIKGRL